MAQETGIKAAREVGHAIAAATNDRDRSRFLLSYAGDLLWDGAALMERAHEGLSVTPCVWVMRDLGTHLAFDADTARSIRQAFGDNSERQQWYRLDKHPHNPDQRAMTECTAEEAIAYLQKESAERAWPAGTVAPVH